MTYEIKFYMGNHSRINETNDSVRSNVWYELKRQGITIRSPFAHCTLNKKRGTPSGRSGRGFSISRGERLFDCLSEDQLDQMVNQARLYFSPAVQSPVRRDRRGGA